MNELPDRRELIPGWDQSRLAQAAVVIAGVGALGNEVARILAMSGVGRLILCDPDVVEASNLSRTVLFRSADVGKPKARAAAEYLSELAPGIAIDARCTSLVQGVGLAELRDCSLVLGCLDSRTARLQLAGRCQLAQAPSIDAGTHPWGGEVRVFTDVDGPCYGCSLGEAGRAEADSPWSCVPPLESAPEGAAAPSSAVVGGWAGTLAIRYLLGLPIPVGIVNIMIPSGTAAVVRQERDPACPLHHRAGRARKLKASVRSTARELASEVGAEDGIFAWFPFSSDSLGGLLTENLRDAPADIRLEKLGVAPREILYRRTNQEFEWLELAE